MSPKLAISWILCAFVAITALTIGALAEPAPRSTQERVYAVAATLKCPQCAGQSVAESDAAIAREMRGEIATMIDGGASDDEIVTVLASGYDVDINLEPSGRGITGLVWAIPVVAGVAALAALIAVFRRWGSEARLDVTEDDERLVAASRAAASGDAGGDP